MASNLSPQHLPFTIERNVMGMMNLIGHVYGQGEHI